MEKLMQLETEYKQEKGEFREQIKFVYQIPSLLLLINSAVIGVSFGYLKDNIIAQCILLSFGLLLSFTLFINVRLTIATQADSIMKMSTILRQISDIEKERTRYEAQSLLILWPLNWFVICIIAMCIGLYSLFTYTIVEWFISDPINNFVANTSTAIFVVIIGAIVTLFMIYIIIQIIGWFMVDRKIGVFKERTYL